MITYYPYSPRKLSGRDAFSFTAPIQGYNDPDPEWVLVYDPTNSYRPGARFDQYDLKAGIVGNPGSRGFAIGTTFQNAITGQVKRVAASPRFFRSRARLVVE